MTTSICQGIFSRKHQNVVKFKAVSYNNGDIHCASEKVSIFHGFFKAKGSGLTSSAKVVTGMRKI